jgi:hypothetical protein
VEVTNCFDDNSPLPAGRSHLPPVELMRLYSDLSGEPELHSSVRGSGSTV